MVKKKTVKSENSVISAIVFGSVIAVVVSLLGSLMIAFMINGGHLEEQGLGYAVMIITCLSSVVGAIAARRGNDRFKLQKSLAVGVIYYIVLLAISWTAFSGPVAGLAVTGLLVLGGCTCTSFLRLKRNRSRVGYIRKRFNR